MHELSIMTQIVDSILSEASKRHATKVEEVELEVGEYTMLGEEQLRFAYQVLSRDNILQGSKLKIKRLPGKIKCSCGYEGNTAPTEEAPHKVSPLLECPKCKGGAEITEGRECVIRNIRMVVPDV